MKAILVINVNGEKLHEKEIELKDNDHAYENSPIARMTLLEKRCTQNERIVRRELQEMVNEWRYKFYVAVTMEVFVMCESKMNNTEITEKELREFEKQIV
jgi:hypothetical protein